MEVMNQGVARHEQTRIIYGTAIKKIKEITKQEKIGVIKFTRAD